MTASLLPTARDHVCRARGCGYISTHACLCTRVCAARGTRTCTHAAGCCAAVRAAVRRLCQRAPICAAPSTLLIPSTAPQRCPEPRVSSLPLSALCLSRSPRIFRAHQTVNSPSYQLQGYLAAPAAASQPAAQPRTAPLPPRTPTGSTGQGTVPRHTACPPARPALTHSYAGKRQRGRSYSRDGGEETPLLPPPRPAERGRRTGRAVRPRTAQRAAAGTAALPWTQPGSPRGRKTRAAMPRGGLGTEGSVARRHVGAGPRSASRSAPRGARRAGMGGEAVRDAARRR